GAPGRVQPSSAAARPAGSRGGPDHGAALGACGLDAWNPIFQRRRMMNMDAGTITADPAIAAELTPGQQDLRERARRFVDEVLIPNEELAEISRGQIPEGLEERIKRESIEAGLSGGLHARENGGQGWSKLEWFLVEEQFGRSTNALSWHVPSAYNVLAKGTPEQIDRYLKPALRGELHDAYAVTESDAGSDPSRIQATAKRSDGGWVINRANWFV